MPGDHDYDDDNNNSMKTRHDIDIFELVSAASIRTYSFQETKMWRPKCAVGIYKMHIYMHVRMHA
jgi:hypothetical protein